MATITLEFVNGANTIRGTLTVSNANAARLLAAEKINMGTADNQTTADALIRRFLDEMIGDTKTIERNSTPVTDIPVT
jgi:hypothetical protein